MHIYLSAKQGLCFPICHSICSTKDQRFGGINRRTEIKVDCRDFDQLTDTQSIQKLLVLLSVGRGEQYNERNMS